MGLDRYDYEIAENCCPMCGARRKHQASTGCIIALEQVILATMRQASERARLRAIDLLRQAAAELDEILGAGRKKSAKSQVATRLLPGVPKRTPMYQNVQATNGKRRRIVDS